MSVYVDRLPCSESSFLCLYVYVSLVVIRAVSDWHFLHNPPLLANLVAPKLPGVFICQPSDVLWMDACLQLLSFHICMRTPPLDSSAYVVPFLKQLLCVAYPPLFNSSRRRTTVSLQQGEVKKARGVTSPSRRSRGEGERDEATDKRVFKDKSAADNRHRPGQHEDEARTAHRGHQENSCSLSLSSSVLFATTTGEGAGRAPHPPPVPVGAAITGVLVYWASNPMKGRWASTEVLSASKSGGFEAHERQVVGGQSIYEVYVQRRHSAPPFTLPLLDLRRVKPLRLDWERSGCNVFTSQRRTSHEQDDSRPVFSPGSLSKGMEWAETQEGEGDEADERSQGSPPALADHHRTQQVTFPTLNSGLWLLSGALFCLQIDSYYHLLPFVSLKRIVATVDHQMTTIFLVCRSQPASSLSCSFVCSGWGGLS